MKTIQNTFKIAFSSCHFLTQFTSLVKVHLPRITFVKTFKNVQSIYCKMFPKFIAKLLHFVYLPSFEFEEICLGALNYTLLTRRNIP